MMAVQENQLAGHDDEALLGVAAEGLIAAVQQLNQLAGIAAGRGVAQLAGGVEGNTGLGGVRYHKTYLGLVGQRHEGLVLGVGVQGARNHVDALQTVHSLTVLTALQIHVIQTVLTVQPVYHTALDGLNHHHAAVEIGLLVHVPQNPVYKGAKEIALTELNHFLRHHAFRCRTLVQSL